jgi:phage-related tail protein
MGLGDWFTKAWDTTRETFGKLQSSVSSAADWVSDKVTSGTSAVYNKTESVISTAYKDIKSALGGIKDSYDKTINFASPLLWGIGGLAAIFLLSSFRGR